MHSLIILDSSSRVSFEYKLVGHVMNFKQDWSRDVNEPYGISIHIEYIGNTNKWVFIAPDLSPASIPSDLKVTAELKEERVDKRCV